MATAIRAHELKKTFYSVRKQPGVWGSVKGLFSREKIAVEAVKGVSFTIEEGELVGFLGPNGAGKTTTLKMLSGILYPSSGEATVLGYEPFDRKHDMLRQMSLVMGNKNQLWWDLPAWDSFVVMRELYGVPHAVFDERMAFLLEEMQLKDKVHTQVRKMSLGERMKCELIAALLHNPRVVFLDEPTIGLDLVSQKRIREFLRARNTEDCTTMILTSHYMQDVQELCERVIIIDHGTMVFDGTLTSLIQAHSDERRLRLRFSRPVDRVDLERYGAIVDATDGESEDEAIVLKVRREDAPTVTAAVLQALPVEDIAIEDVSLDDVIRDLFDRQRPSAQTIA